TKRGRTISSVKISTATDMNTLTLQNRQSNNESFIVLTHVQYHRLRLSRVQSTNLRQYSSQAKNTIIKFDC
ncbi:MAG: hypothetical protein ACKPKO_27240, partial [Candidatus Fonsibacter sp.]